MHAVVMEDSVGSDAEILNSLRTLRTVRVLRFFRVIKLVRLLRTARIFARWESRLAINYNTLQLGKSVAATFVLSHWIACFWVVQAFVFQGDAAPLWTGGYPEGYFADANTTTANATADAVAGGRRLKGGAAAAGGGSAAGSTQVPAGHAPSWLTENYPYCWQDEETTMGYACKDPGLIYAASLYHTCLCLFGGLAGTPGNSVELLLAALLMLLAGLIWSHVMATIVAIVATSDPNEAAFRATMDSLNSYMALEGMPHELRRRAREYFQKSKHVRRTDQRGSLLELMPYSLQADFILFTSKVWIERVWFLGDLNVVGDTLEDQADQLFLVELAKAVIPKVFAPDDWVPLGAMYILHRGIALYKGKVLTKGRVFGEDFLLNESARADTSAARAMNYLEVYVLMRDDVLSIGERYPSTWAKIRRKILWRLFRRDVVNRCSELSNSLDVFRMTVEAAAATSEIRKDVHKAATAAYESAELSPTPPIPGSIPAPVPQIVAKPRHVRNKARSERRGAGAGGGSRGVLSSVVSSSGGRARIGSGFEGRDAEADDHGAQSPPPGAPGSPPGSPGPLPPAHPSAD
jgi:hypothetical protein